MEMTGYLALLLPSIRPYLTVIALGLIIIGLINCIWGYQWLKIAQGSQGFFAGLIAGAAIGYYSHVNQLSQAFALVMIGGVTGAAMSLAYNRLAFFLMGGLTGTLLILVAMVVTGGFTNLIFVAGGALVCGCLLAVMEDAAIMLTTPLIGAWGLAAGLAVLSGSQGFDFVGINQSFKNALGASSTFNLAWLVFALAGLAIQQGILRKNLTNQRSSLVRPNFEPENAGNVAVKLQGGITDKYGNPVNPNDINWISVSDDKIGPSINNKNRR